jgi:hypothetical protein
MLLLTAETTCRVGKGENARRGAALGETYRAGCEVHPVSPSSSDSHSLPVAESANRALAMLLLTAVTTCRVGKGGGGGVSHTGLQPKPQRQPACAYVGTRAYTVLLLSMPATTCRVRGGGGGG